MSDDGQKTGEPADMTVDRDVYERLCGMRIPVNRMEDYRRFQQTRRYLEDVVSRAGMEWTLKPNPKTEAAMQATGYKKWDKFIHHAKDWTTLSRPIPRAYLNHIEADLDVLKVLIVFDAEDYDHVLALVKHPSSWTLRLMATVYTRRSFPEGVETEEDCVRHILADPSVAEHHMHAAINYRGLKTVYLNPDTGATNTHYYRPALQITRTHLVYSVDDRNEGVTRIAGKAISLKIPPAPSSGK